MSDGSDFDEARERALERLKHADTWLSEATDNRDLASRERAMAAFEAKQLGVSYFDIGAHIGLSKTTAVRLVKEGEMLLRLRGRDTDR